MPFRNAITLCPFGVCGDSHTKCQVQIKCVKTLSS
jgi:hypothetical protein